MNRPPPRAEQLLRIVTCRSERHGLLGDMAEDFARLVTEAGERTARRWYWKQVITSLPPLLRCRVRRCRRRFRVNVTTFFTRTRRGLIMDALTKDLRFAIRTLVRRPGYAVTAVLTLAVGIGSTTAIFSVVNGVFFKGIPGVRSDGLVNISQNVDGRYFDMSWPVTQELARSSNTVDDVAGMFLVPLALGGVAGSDPAVALSAGVSANFLSTLGLSPQIGRFFEESEDYPTAADVSVISYHLWQTRFDGDPTVLGRVLTVNGYPTRVIGVTPEGFNGPAVGVRLGAYVPLGIQAPGLPGSSSLMQWNSGQIEVIGRLAAKQNTTNAQTELSTLAQEFVSVQGSGSGVVPQYRVRVETWSPIPPTIRTGVTLFFSVLMAVVAILLGMACLNVTNMLLFQSLQRRGELSIRLAMGASRGRLVRQLLTETSVLFGFAAGAGVLFAVWASGLFLSFQPPLPPGFAIDLNVGLDVRVLLFCLVTAAICCFSFGLAPAFRATRPDVTAALKSDATGLSGRTRVRSAMVAFQMAGTLVLLVGAGLFVRALQTMKSLDPGWNPDGVFVAEFDLDLNGMTPDEGTVYYDALLEQVRGISGVEAAGLAAKLPLGGSSSFGWVNVANVPAPAGQGGYDAYLNRVSDDYFGAVGLSIIQGRDFETRQNREGRVAVINETMARRFWPSGGAVGATFFVGQLNSGTPVEVVGVVEDAKYRRLVEETPNFYYVSSRQYYNAQMVLHLKIDPNALSDVAARLRAAARELAPTLPVPNLRSLDEVLGVFVLPQRIGAFVAGTIGMVGLLLGMVGVYGVTAFAVGQRRREIGVRIALGARHTRVISGMIWHGLLPPTVGLILGLIVALVFAQVASRFLGGVSPVDLLTFGVVILMLVVAAVLATLIPTVRAVRANPVSALRSS